MKATRTSIATSKLDPKAKPSETISSTSEAEWDANDHVRLSKDRFFNPWRFSKGENARTVVKDAINLIANYETYFELRKRARKEFDQKTFEAIIEAVVCEMILAHLSGDERGSAIAFSKAIISKRSRYRPPFFSEAMPKIIERMSAPEMAYVVLQKGFQQNFGNRGQRTLIWPGQKLISRVEEHKVDRKDIGSRPTEEIIILKAQRHGFWDDGSYQEYEDTPVTKRMRMDLAALNEWLANADLSFDRSSSALEDYDLNSRRLRRIFTQGSFESGGRLFGGFWQTMSKPHRLTGIRINGEPVVGLDYGQIASRIVYGMSNAAPAQGDLYAIEGLHSNYRDGVKKLMNSMLFADKPLARKPKGIKDLLPNWNVQTLCDLIIKSHPLIASHFYSGIGHKTQFIESELMMKIMRELMAKGVVCLPIHDGVIVSQSHKDLVSGVMERLAEQAIGLPIPVSEEEVAGTVEE